MDYPNITLHISASSVPQIRLYSAADDFKVLQDFPTGLTALLQNVANVFELDMDDEELWERADFGDELALTAPEIDFDEEAMDWNYLLEYVKQLSESKEEFPEMAAEVLEEVESNWLADVLASVLDSAQDFLIGKTLLFGDELGIEQVRLIDESTTGRMPEKMSQDLAEMGRRLEF